MSWPACTLLDSRGTIRRADVSAYPLISLLSAIFKASRFGYDYRLINLGAWNGCNISLPCQRFWYKRDYELPDLLLGISGHTKPHKQPHLRKSQELVSSTCVMMLSNYYLGNFLAKHYRISVVEILPVKLLAMHYRLYCSRVNASQV